MLLKNQFNMKPIFNHYYKFRVKKSNNKFLELISQHGFFKALEERKKRITKLTSVQVANTYCYHSQFGDMRLLNPFFGEIIGLCQFETDDTVIVIYNFQKLTVEFFISELTKKGGLAILDLVKNYELDSEIFELRKEAVNQIPVIV